MRYGLIILLSLLSVAAWSQSPPITTTKLTATRQLVLPQDTLVITTSDSGSLAFKGDTLYKAKPRAGFTTCKWVPVGYVGISNATIITGLIAQGSNVTISGLGTIASPYVINAAGGAGATNLDTTRTSTTVMVTSSNGTSKPINGATHALAGVQTAQDKTVLDSLRTSFEFNLPITQKDSFNSTGIVIQPNMGMVSFGNSITAEPTSYAFRYATEIGGGIHSFAVGGQWGIQQMDSLYSTYDSVMTNKRKRLATWAPGVNDIRYDRSDRNKQHISDYARLFLYWAFQDSIITLSNMTLTGGWGIAGGSGVDRTNYASTNTIVDTVTFTVNSDHVFIVFGTTPSATGSNYSRSVDIYSDGVLVSNTNTFDKGQNDPFRQDLPIYVDLKSYGAHKIKIVNSDAGRYAFVRYAGWMKAPYRCTPAMLLAVPNVTVAGSNGVPRSAFDSLNHMYQLVIDSFLAKRYPVRLIDINKGYDPATMSADGIHPNTNGYDQWMKQIYANTVKYSYLQNALGVLPDTAYNYSGGIKIRSGLSTYVFPAIDTIFSSSSGGSSALSGDLFIKNTTTPQTANFNVNGASTIGNMRMFASGTSQYVGYNTGLFSSATGVTLNGYLAGAQNTSGAYLNANGYSSGEGNTTGSGNNYYGAYSGYQNSTGQSNTGFGFEALKSNLNSYNTAFGYQAGGQRTNDLLGIYIGYNAGMTGSGNNNIYIGRETANGTLGANNIMLGQIGQSLTTSNRLLIEAITGTLPLIDGDFAVDSLRINGYFKVRDSVKIEKVPNGTRIDSLLVWNATTKNVNKVSNSLPLSGSFSDVGAATTTFTVTIGATMANTTYKVNASPTAALSAALFYITNKTTTTFDVVYLSGITGDVQFDWILVP